MNNRLINTKVAAAGGCTDIVDNYDPFGGNGVALYQLNGDATDVSTNYDGAATNVTYGTGQFGQAGVFNGSSSYITASGLGITGNTSFTISTWVNTTSSSSELFFFLGNGTLNSSLYISVESGGVVRVGDFGTDLFSSTTSVNDGNWHHIALTSNGTTTKLYIDGSESNSLSYTWAISPDNMELGRGTSTYYYNGKIDQVRIFNTALTPLEIEALYTEELCICDGTVDTLQVLGDTSCIALYQLDGNANDLSGNYSGTATNVSYGVGEFDLAGVFNGSSSTLFISNTSTSVVNYDSDFTISLWTKLNSLPATNVQYLYTGFGTRDIIISVESSTSVINARLFDGAIHETISNTLSQNVWYNVVFVRSKTNGLKLYVNSLENDTDTFTGNASNYTSLGFKDSIGCYRPSEPRANFDGSIDQVRIFNKALDQGEVDILYNETACTKVCSGTTNTLNILPNGDTSCIAAYPLDGSPLDLSGNYNGVQVGNINYRQGEFDLCAYFTGGYIQLPSNPISGSNPRTVSFWVNDISSTDSNVIYSSGSDLELQGFAVVLLNDGNIRFYGGINGGTITTTNVIASNIWYHIAVTYDGGVLSTSSINIYVNGSLQSSIKEGSASGVLNTGTEAARIANPSLGTNVLVDQIRIFNKALSLEEVGILYNNETPCN